MDDTKSTSAEWPFIYPASIRWLGYSEDSMLIEYYYSNIRVDRRAKTIKLDSNLVKRVNDDRITDAMVERIFEIATISRTLYRLQLNKPMEFLQQCDQLCDEIERLIGARGLHLQTGILESFMYTATEARLEAKRYTSGIRVIARRYEMAIELVKRGLPLITTHSPCCDGTLKYFAKGAPIWRGCIEHTIYNPEDMLPVLASFDALRAHFPDDVARMMAVCMYPIDHVIGCNTCNPRGGIN
jgi:hypothetical protein